MAAGVAGMTLFFASWRTFLKAPQLVFKHGDVQGSGL